MANPPVAPILQMPQAFSHGDQAPLYSSYYQSHVNLRSLEGPLAAERKGVDERKKEPAELIGVVGKVSLATIIDYVPPVQAAGAPPPVIAHSAANIRAAAAANAHLNRIHRFQQENMRAAQTEIKNELDKIMAPVNGERLPLAMEKLQLNELKTKHLAMLDREKAVQIEYLTTKWTDEFQTQLVNTDQYSEDEANQLCNNYIGVIEAEFEAKKKAAGEYYASLDKTYKDANAQAFEDSAIEYLFHKYVDRNGPLAMANPDPVAERQRKRDIVKGWIERGEINLKFNRIKAGSPEDQSLTVDNEEGTGKVHFNVNDITKDNAIDIIMAWKLQPENANKEFMTLTLKSKPPHTTDEIANIRLLAATAELNGIKVKFGSPDYAYNTEQKKEVKQLKGLQDTYYTRMRTQEMTREATKADIFNQLDAKASELQTLTLKLEQQTQVIKEMFTAQVADDVLLRAFSEHDRIAQLHVTATGQYHTLQDTLDQRYQLAAIPDAADKDALVRRQEQHIKIALDCTNNARRYLIGGVPPAPARAAAPAREEGVIDILNRLHPVAGRTQNWTDRATAITTAEATLATAAANTVALNGVPAVAAVPAAAGVPAVAAAATGIQQRRVEADAALAAAGFNLRRPRL